MPRNQASPEESDPSRRGVASREHHEPDPDVRIGHADPKRSESGEEDSIGRRHPSYRDEDDDDLEDDVDRVSAGSRRSPDREAEAYELDDADVVEEIELDDLEDDDELTRRDGPDEPDA